MGRYSSFKREFVVEVGGLRRPGHPLPWEVELKITSPRMWPQKMLRVGGVVGPAPGSHTGYWRTRAGTVRGHNLRIGSPYAPVCLTLFAHWRREGIRRPGEENL